ncbi:hypothetical protein [Serratia marcescens]|uniref:hypothetical protein n=1 Tax=Serratia marcescens TaxID=615 RepID=UPI0013DC2436|nr:hypothetical protein [Serratia marcescens]EHT9936749.1 hypothetical protein [Serratia marcescens]EIJ6676592.1 hypothetical protein [Serratia marcescens]MDP8601219.1 hypothetical protein [Serratia marcescens]MDP8685919.1 hypothetical protein [Serratia marcescens]MDP8794817.1 hypothetical protein [Serratia marcescens]
MKIITLVITMMLTACSTTHDYTRNAVVGVVDDSVLIVMSPAYEMAGVKYYRPQLSADCGRIYNKYYQMDNNSTGCYINAERITDIHSYREHIAHGSHTRNTSTEFTVPNNEMNVAEPTMNVGEI